MYFQSFFHQRHGPPIETPPRPVGGVAIDPDVHVIVVRLRVTGFAQDEGCPREERGASPNRGGLRR